MAIQCAWNLYPSVHWNATGERIVDNQCVSSVLPVVFRWCSYVFQLCKLILDRQWDTTGCEHQPVLFQWHPSVLMATAVFQCVPIMQFNTEAPGRSSKLTRTGIEIDTRAFQMGCQLSSAASSAANVLDNWQLAELPQSGGREFDPRRVHDNLSVPLWVYMRFSVP